LGLLSTLTPRAQLELSSVWFPLVPPRAPGKNIFRPGKN
jgi:hypothetical protein